MEAVEARYGPGKAVWAAAVVLAAVSALGSIAWATPGDLDSGFAVRGARTTNFGWGDGVSSASVMIRQSDGKLVVGGSGTNGASGFALVRYAEDGSPDASFGDAGRVVTVLGDPFSSYQEEVSGLVEQADGKLVAVGLCVDADGNLELVLVRYQSDGSVDSSFGSSGIVRSTMTAYYFAPDLALQPDGKLIVTAETSGPNGDEVLVLRYEADGSPDSYFGVGGTVVLDLGGEGLDVARGVVVQDDGKIVIAGSSSDSFDSDSVIALARLGSDGTLDAGFGSAGVVTTNIAAMNEEALDVLLQSDGRLVVVGYASLTVTNSDFAVLRYEADGTLDATFGGTGVVITPLSSTRDTAYTAVQQSDGRLVVAGETRSIGSDFAAVRYNADGTLDASFGTGGIAATDVGGSGDVARAVAYQSDGKIVLAGTAADVPDPHIALVRHEADGSLDATFGAGGKVITSASSSFDEAADILIQKDGKLVAVGSTYVQHDNDFALARYDANGALDPGFGIAGRVITDIGNDDDYGAGIVQQSSGRLVVGGTTRLAASNHFALLRYNLDGSLDSSFGVGGKITTPVGPAGAAAFALIQQTDGRIVLAGYSDGGGATDFALVRYNPDGTLDGSFGSGGKVLTSGMGVALALLQQSDGKLVAAGYASGVGGRLFAVARYETDGSLDPTFGHNGTIFLATTQADWRIFFDIVEQADAKLVGAGGDVLLRMTTTGDLDSSFGSGGFAAGPIVHYAAVQLGDGKLIGAGAAYTPEGPRRFALMRYGPSGSVDAGFGDDGRVITALGTVESTIVALRLQADTRLVAVGTVDSDFGLARYFTQSCGNGVLDAGEECDDGNVAGGDCCSSNCQAEPDGPASCDGNVCTRSDTCSGGACIPGPCQVGAACSICGGSCEAAGGTCGCAF